MNEIKERIVDVLGVVAISHATVANMWELISGINYNAVFLAITSILSIVYLAYRIREVRRASELRNLEIEKHRMEMEKLKAEIRKIGVNTDFYKLNKTKKDE